MRLILALQTFFRVLFSAEVAERVQQMLDVPVSAPEQPAAAAPAASSVHARSEAITLLATLQRDARFVDIVMEPLDGYSDAQVGAAARDVLRDCGKTLDRVLGLQPVASQAEGETMEVPAGYDAARFRLTGAVAKTPPVGGTLVHPGWQATRCELGAWSGSQEAALVVAPAEVQIAS